MAGKMQLLWHKHGNKILTALSMLGTTVTVVSAIKNTEKHVNRPVPFDKKERIKQTLKDYAPTMALYGVTTAITAVNGIRNEKLLASYSAALIASNTLLQRYRNEVRSEHPDIDDKAISHIVDTLPVDESEIEVATRGGGGFNKIFFPAGNRMWMGSIEAIDDALGDCYTMIGTKGFCTFKDFYDQLGLSSSEKDLEYLWAEPFQLDIYPLIDQGLDEVVVKIEIDSSSQPIATNYYLNN